MKRFLGFGNVHDLCRRAQTYIDYLGYENGHSRVIVKRNCHGGYNTVLLHECHKLFGIAYLCKHSAVNDRIRQGNECMQILLDIILRRCCEYLEQSIKCACNHLIHNRLLHSEEFIAFNPSFTCRGKNLGQYSHKNFGFCSSRLYIIESIYLRITYIIDLNALECGSGKRRIKHVRKLVLENYLLAVQLCRRKSSVKPFSAKSLCSGKERRGVYAIGIFLCGNNGICTAYPVQILLGYLK